MLGSVAFVGADSSSHRRPRTKSQEALEFEERNKFSFVRFISTNMYVFCLFSYTMWTLLGILFYKYYDRYTFATAFFYAMEAGLSVGFCNPSERDDWSRLFTIFYVLLGSSLVSGAIGVFASSLISTRRSVITVRHDWGAITFKDPNTNKTTAWSVFISVWYHIKWLIGWYHFRSMSILIFLFLLWVGWGAAYAVVVEKYDIITALYWAVTTISTGGLESPECLNGTTGDTCDIGTMRGGIMGFYMMVGVPIYAITLGQISRLIVTVYLRERERYLINQPIEDADFLFAANILSPQGSETLVVGEFILLELLRLGLTDKDQIEEIKKKFNRIDVTSRGELDIDDLRRTGLVVPRKLHSVEVRKKQTQRQSRTETFLGALRYSATNLTEQILSATANFQLNPSPTMRQRRASRDDNMGSSNSLGVSDYNLNNNGTGGGAVTGGTPPNSNKGSYGFRKAGGGGVGSTARALFRGDYYNNSKNASNRYYQNVSSQEQQQQQRNKNINNNSNNNNNNELDQLQQQQQQRQEQLLYMIEEGEGGTERRSVRRRDPREEEASSGTVITRGGLPCIGEDNEDIKEEEERDLEISQNGNRRRNGGFDKTTYGNNNNVNNNNNNNNESTYESKTNNEIKSANSNSNAGAAANETTGMGRGFLSNLFGGGGGDNRNSISMREPIPLTGEEKGDRETGTGTRKSTEGLQEASSSTNNSTSNRSSVKKKMSIFGPLFSSSSSSQPAQQSQSPQLQPQPQSQPQPPSLIPPPPQSSSYSSSRHTPRDHMENGVHIIFEDDAPSMKIIQTAHSDYYSGGNGSGSYGTGGGQLDSPGLIQVYARDRRSLTVYNPEGRYGNNNNYNYNNNEEAGSISMKSPNTPPSSPNINQNQNEHMMVGKKSFRKSIRKSHYGLNNNNNNTNNNNNNQTGQDRMMQAAAASSATNSRKYKNDYTNNSQRGGAGGNGGNGMDEDCGELLTDGEMFNDFDYNREEVEDLERSNHSNNPNNNNNNREKLGSIPEYPTHSSEASVSNMTAANNVAGSYNNNGKRDERSGSIVSVASVTSGGSNASSRDVMSNNNYSNNTSNANRDFLRSKSPLQRIWAMDEELQQEPINNSIMIQPIYVQPPPSLQSTKSTHATTGKSSGGSNGSSPNSGGGSGGGAGGGGGVNVSRENSSGPKSMRRGSLVSTPRIIMDSKDEKDDDGIIRVAIKRSSRAIFRPPASSVDL